MAYLAAINHLVDDSQASDESAGGVRRRKTLLAARVSKNFRLQKFLFQ
jgi:hypothetical protein